MVEMCCPSYAARWPKKPRPDSGSSINTNPWGGLTQPCATDRGSSCARINLCRRQRTRIVGGIERYVEADIEYKRHPERVTELMSDPDPELVIPPPAATELYNVEEDPLEENNLAQQEAPRTARMLVELENWFEEVEAERQRIQPDGSIIE